MYIYRLGDLVVELYWKHAPNTCRNFAELARRGYFNGVKFHRIIKDFMIQGGDPTATGMNSVWEIMFAMEMCLIHKSQVLFWCSICMFVVIEIY